MFNSGAKNDAAHALRISGDLRDVSIFRRPISTIWREISKKACLNFSRQAIGAHFLHCFVNEETYSFQNKNSLTPAI
jgi:hypothetical protein